MSLPTTGQFNWGVPLNDYITNAVLAVANQALTSINTHTTATDPHGDRAYAAGLVAPLTTGVNGPNGFVQLNSSGQIPSSLLPAGSTQTNIFDVKRDFGALGNGSSDDSTPIQNALNACAAAGGGEVWVPDGIYAIGHQLIIGTGTWLHLSPGAVIRRIIPIGGSAPSIMLSNVSFAGGTGTPATGNMLISGGKWDAVGSGLTSNCTPILLVQANFAAIIQTFFNGVASNPLVELNGSTYITVRDCVFTGTALSSSGGVVPAIRLNSTSTSTTASGMASGVYNNDTCSNIVVEACTQVLTGSQPSANRFLGTDLYAGYSHNIVIVTGCSTGGGTDAAYPPADFTHISQGSAFGNLWNIASGNALLDLTTTGNVFIGPVSASGTPPAVNIAGRIQYATGYPGSITPETWHNMSLNSGWSSGNDTRGSNYIPAYKLLPDGSVALRGVLNTPFSNQIGFTFATLPAAYFNTQSNPCTATVSNANGGQQGLVTLDSSGNLQLQGGIGVNINICLDNAVLRRI